MQPGACTPLVWKGARAGSELQLNAPWRGAPPCSDQLRRLGGETRKTWSGVETRRCQRELRAHSELWQSVVKRSLACMAQLTLKRIIKKNTLLGTIGGEYFKLSLP